MALCCGIVRPAHAAAFEASFASRGDGDGTVTLRINPQGESLNAFEGFLTVSGDGARFVGVHDGGSIVGAWIDAPTIMPDGRIRFSGIVPGGFEGASGTVLSATVVLGDKEAVVSVQEGRALKNDGVATAAALTVDPLHIAGPFKQRAGNTADVIAPETFQPEAGRQDGVFGGDPFISFAAQDKLSGIGHYEVCIGSAPCVAAESPYRLDPSVAGESVVVKAYDRKGNVRSATVPDAQLAKATYPRRSRAAILSTCLLLLLAASALYLLLHRRRSSS